MEMRRRGSGAHSLGKQPCAGLFRHQIPVAGCVGTLFSGEKVITATITQTATLSVPQTRIPHGGAGSASRACALPEGGLQEPHGEPGSTARSRCWAGITRDELWDVAQVLCGITWEELWNVPGAMCQAGITQEEPWDVPGALCRTGITREEPWDVPGALCYNPGGAMGCVPCGLCRAGITQGHIWGLSPSS